MVALNLLRGSPSGSESVCSEVASEKDLYAIINERDNEHSNFKRIIAELNELVEKQKEEISKLKSQSKQFIENEEQKDQIKLLQVQQIS